MDGSTVRWGHFVVYPFARGSDLFNTLERCGSCASLPFVCAALHQTLEGLIALHDAAIVHADIKLENLLFNGDFSDPAVDIADFDMSTPIGAPSRGGTTAYAPPEIAEPAIKHTKAEISAHSVSLSS